MICTGDILTFVQSTDMYSVGQTLTVMSVHGQTDCDGEHIRAVWSGHDALPVSGHWLSIELVDRWIHTGIFVVKRANKSVADQISDIVNSVL